MKRVGMKLTGKLNSALVVQPQQFKLDKDMLSITCHNNTQEMRSACCCCPASNWCPGLVSSQCLIPFKCTYHWRKKKKKKWVCWMTHARKKKKKKKKKKEEEEEEKKFCLRHVKEFKGCVLPDFLSVMTKPASQGLLLRAYVIIIPATFYQQHLTDAFSVRYRGYSFCHPPHDGKISFQLLHHAVHSSLQTNDPVATFMLLPHWRGFSCNAYMSLLNHYPGFVQVSAKFPAAGNIQFQTPRYWFNTIPNRAQPSNPMQLITVWDLHSREALDNANKDWLQLLKHDIPGAHWLPLQPPNSAIPLHTQVNKSLSGYGHLHHLCYEVQTIPKRKLTYDNPQSWPSQGIALPQHTRDLQIVAVWNTAARFHLNNQSPTWLQGLAKDIPEAKWFVKNVRNDPIHNARHGVMPGIGKCEKLPLDKKQIAKVPHKPATDSLSSLHQRRKQILNPENFWCLKHRHHVQGDVLRTILNLKGKLARTSQGHIFFYKVKTHAGIAGNECADKVAKYQSSLKGNDLTDTGIPSAGP
eukprot:1145583-Pelagomonas_calceolata.AAC.1